MEALNKKIETTGRLINYSTKDKIERKMLVISTSAYCHPHRIRHNYQLIYAGTEPNGKGVNCCVLQSSNEEHLFAFKIRIPNNAVQHGSNI